jgi:hypothetical protein
MREFCDFCLVHTIFETGDSKGKTRGEKIFQNTFPNSFQGIRGPFSRAQGG